MLHRAGWKLHSGRFLGALVEWFIIVAFLIASFDVLGLNQVNMFLQDVILSYLPQVIIAVLILLVAGVVAQVTQRLVTGATNAAGLPSANFLGAISKWAIWVFAVLVALSHLGIAAPFVQIHAQRVHYDSPVISARTRAASGMLRQSEKHPHIRYGCLDATFQALFVCSELSDLCPAM